MKYKVALHRSENDISGSGSAAPSCWSEGDTEQEDLANIHDVVRSPFRFLPQPIPSAIP